MHDGAKTEPKLRGGAGATDDQNEARCGHAGRALSTGAFRATAGTRAGASAQLHAKRVAGPGAGATGTASR